MIISRHSIILLLQSFFRFGQVSYLNLLCPLCYFYSLFLRRVILIISYSSCRKMFKIKIKNQIILLAKRTVVSRINLLNYSVVTNFICHHIINVNIFIQYYFIQCFGQRNCTKRWPTASLKIEINMSPPRPWTIKKIIFTKKKKKEKKTLHDNPSN